MAYELGQVEISNLLVNNPTLASIVQNALASNQWPNGNPVCPVAPYSGPGSSITDWFGILQGSPTAIGYAISDPTYGSVSVGCDANGVLHYVIGSSVSSSVQNAGPYVSPTTPPSTTPGCPGWSNIGSFNDFLACIGSAASTAEVIIIGVAGYLVYKEIK
jgi:hypothetical protein